MERSFLGWLSDDILLLLLLPLLQRMDDRRAANRCCLGDLDGPSSELMREAITPICTITLPAFCLVLSIGCGGQCPLDSIGRVSVDCKDVLKVEVSRSKK